MAYATVQDVQARMTRTMSVEEQNICSTLLDDVVLLIDNYNSDATSDAKKLVSCRSIIRALGDGQPIGVPIGATQGSMAALGYSQSWTLANGAVGELYLSKTEKQLLGAGNRIGSYSPVQMLAPETEG